MSQSEKYNLWITVTLNHSYYGLNNCPVMLEPDAGTTRIFRKFGFLFKALSSNKYAILVPENFDFNYLIQEEIHFRLTIKPLDKQFYHVTGTINMNDFFNISDSSQYGIWKELEINLRNIIFQQKSNIEIDITSVEKHYEYICIPKYNEGNTIITLSEEKNRIRFSKSEIELFTIPKAFRFISEEKIKLMQHNEIKTQLWETKEHGEKLISKEIPNPNPGQYSPIDPKNSITTYFYY